jgi:hypothetical protein
VIKASQLSSDPRIKDRLSHCRSRPRPSESAQV